MIINEFTTYTLKSVQIQPFLEKFILHFSAVRFRPTAYIPEQGYSILAILYL